MKLRSRIGALLATVATLTSVGTLAFASPASAFTTLPEYGQYEVVNANSGLCIDIAGESTTDGAAIHQWTCEKGSNQLWYLRQQPTGGHFLMVPTSTYNRHPFPGCLTVPQWSTATGEDLKLGSCPHEDTTLSNQSFGTREDGQPAWPAPGPTSLNRLVNWYSGLCLQIEGASTSNGGDLEQAPCNGSASQNWRFRLVNQPVG